MRSLGNTSSLDFFHTTDGAGSPLNAQLIVTGLPLRRVIIEGGGMVILGIARGKKNTSYFMFSLLASCSDRILESQEVREYDSLAGGVVHHAYPVVTR